MYIQVKYLGNLSVSISKYIFKEHLDTPECVTIIFGSHTLYRDK